MSHYKPKTFFLWRMIAGLLRGIVKLFSAWPLLLIALFFISPIGPHLRWTYTYQDYYGNRTYYACQYLGSRGFINYMHGDDCPFVVMIDRS